MPKPACRMLLPTLAALLTVTLPAWAQRKDALQADAGAVLRPGDIVRIAVWQRPDYNGEFRVSVDGTLAHPLFQAVKVAGVPLAVAKQRLETLLLKYEKEPLVVMEPLHQVSVIGEVRAPNIYAMPRATTVAQAVAQAGGPTERAKVSKVRLFRGGNQLTIDLNDPRSADALLPVRSGDRIVVERKGNFLRDVLSPLASVTAAVVSVVVAVRQ